MFFPISTHFTATLGIPLSSPTLKPESFKRPSPVKQRHFTSDFFKPPTRSLRPIIPNNVCPLRITAAAGTELAGTSSGSTVRSKHYSRLDVSSCLTEVYDPKAFILHAALLRQGFPHCAIFPTAASRRSLDRVSVPVWLVVLSDQLTIAALVGRYPTNKLMVRELVLK